MLSAVIDPRDIYALSWITKNFRISFCDQDGIYQIALSQVKGVGHVPSRRLMAQFGSAQAIFQSMLKALAEVPGGSLALAQEIHNSNSFSKAAKFLASHDRADIRIITPWEDEYPERLKYVYSAPHLALYARQRKPQHSFGTRNALATANKF